MERNIGDQLNKAFEAYRQVSIEKDNAKKELQQMTEYYQQYIQKLQRQIEDQQQLIAQLKAQLSSGRKPSGEVKCESCSHLVDGASTYGKIQHPESKATAAVVPLKMVNNNIDCQDMLDALEAIHGTFRQICSLSRRQKDYLKRFRGGKETANDQQFSMPIQCTDRAAGAETSFFSATRSTVDIPLAPTSLASRGASPDDRDFVDSLTKFSVKFPPPADSEYDFLNSTPERHVALTVPMRRPLSGMPTASNNNEEEDEPSELPGPFVIPPFPSHKTSSSLSQEDVRGPQQSLWSPDLCEAPDVGAELAAPQSSIPDKCAFCHAVVPQEQMNSHLYSHFSPKDETHR
ncbi:TRAF family member-associated NF-kappa-B activator [Syngnathoides biaculeatus]|uniref:TRAF family member-associated NF-kappa-B activator n=1 Tax=Syngnathoides biaculeatus TaxID=300417 RepID=UPI002ADE828B|nr:TRAF family member-associated NF-kappa-B activator [Syngnathoides biaculeatus]